MRENLPQDICDKIFYFALPSVSSRMSIEIKKSANIFLLKNNDILSVECRQILKKQRVHIQLVTRNLINGYIVSRMDNKIPRVTIIDATLFFTNSDELRKSGLMHFEHLEQRYVMIIGGIKFELAWNLL